ncbi:MAG: hypothetical protein QHH02_05240 [Syntrophomonadaceae bacterium]|nr:hypothetical protein [Syntrophomonadaceae bacterium]
MRVLRSIAILVVVSVISCFVWFNYLNPEIRAKKCVNKYLTAIKKGKSTEEYKGAFIADFINILDFRCLDTREELKENGITRFVFLYDVTATDQEGYKLFKKVLFTVDNSGESRRFTIKQIE